MLPDVGDERDAHLFERWSTGREIIFDDPAFARIGPFEQANAPIERQGGTERRLLTGGDEDEPRIGMTTKAVVDIDTLAIDWDRGKGQTRKFQPLSGPWKTWLLDPGPLAGEAEHAQCQAEPRTEASRHDDLRYRTIDASRDGEVTRYLPSELDLAARIWI